MKHFASSLLLTVAMTACASDPSPIDTSGQDEPTVEERIPTEKLAAVANAYVGALIAHDEAEVSRLVSSEIFVQAEKRGMNILGFMDHQTSSLQRTLNLAPGEVPQFEIASASGTAGTYKVVLSFRGVELTKPTYFVTEGGEIRISLKEPGFSKALRASRTDNYKVRAAYGEANMLCDNNHAYVNAVTKKTDLVNCFNHCGYWAGTYFQKEGTEAVKYCDWNTWGDDVIVNSLDPDGWHCNDNC